MCPFILFFTPSKNFFCYGTHALAWILAYILTNTVTDVKYFFIKKHFHENLGELTPAIFRDREENPAVFVVARPYLRAARDTRSAPLGAAAPPLSLMKKVLSC